VHLAKDFSTRGRVARWISRAYAVDGDQERAISATEQALKAHTFVTPAFLRIDPHYTTLRNNPEFQKLLAGGAVEH